MLTALLSFGRPLARLFRRDCLSIVLRDLSSWLLIGCCFTSVAFTVCCEQKTWELGTLVPPPRQCFLNPGHSVHVVVVFAAAVFVLPFLPAFALAIDWAWSTSYRQRGGHVASRRTHLPVREGGSVAAVRRPAYGASYTKKPTVLLTAVVLFHGAQFKITRRVGNSV